MIDERIKGLLAPDKNRRLLIIDKLGFAYCFDITSLLASNGFEVYRYANVEDFRVLFEERLKDSAEKTAVIAPSDIYVPYDIQKTFQKVSLSFTDIFPKLNSDVVKRSVRDIDLISFAYDSCYEDCREAAQTEAFLRNTAFTSSMVGQYCQTKTQVSNELCLAAAKYTDWIAIAKQNAAIRYYAVKYDISVDLSLADEEFMRFIGNGYGSLQTIVGREYPAIVTRTLGVMTIGGGNEKAALILMDGMSLFDFEVISRYFTGIEYDYHCSYAIIPTTTPISRQSLLSGKFPRELEKPFSLANEEKEFIAAAKELGYTDSQIQYARGFEPDISPLAKLVAVIVNEIDNIVHGQKQERMGMLGDMNVLGKSGKLQRLIRQLAGQGFTVYITADHGNTPCVGVGGFRSSIGIETRSMRMTVLKDFAEVNDLLTQNATEYQGYFLDKSYRYFVCNHGVSFDNKGESVMTHGGISIDEIIVPFIRIKEVKQLG
jgi:hypothetical protein